MLHFVSANAWAHNEASAAGASVFSFPKHNGNLLKSNFLLPPSFFLHFVIAFIMPRNHPPAESDWLVLYIHAAIRKTEMAQSSAQAALRSVSTKADSDQGKVAELRAELDAGGRKDKTFSAKKVALKKIVANMTMNNNDMVALFPDIIAQMSIPSLDIKKM